MEEKKVNERKLLNHFAMVSWTVTVVVILVAYLLEVVKGERTILYYAGILITGALPVIIAMVIKKANPEDRRIRYLIAIGYSLLYAYVVLTGDTILTFVYFVPVLAALIAYSDKKLLMIYGVSNIVINVVSVLYRVLVLHMAGNDNIADYEIQILLTLLVMIISYMACKRTGEVNSYKKAVLEANAKTQESTLEHVLKSTGVLCEKIEEVNLQAKSVETKSQSAQVSIEEITKGTADVAENVQQQLGMSNGIGDDLEALNHVSQSLQDNFLTTQDMTKAGLVSVENLAQSATMVATSKEQVEQATMALMQEIQEAKEILSLIHSITEQTNLLSLNASIEAARVGEQGKGFAVVAGEIQKLSGDTGEATDRINNILEVLSEEADRVNQAVGQLGEVSDRQNELIQQTNQQFHVINTDIGTMSESIEEQKNALSEINANNTQIAGSIANTSAFTEELTASSENTMSLTKESLEQAQSMSHMLDEIMVEVKALEEAMK